MKKTTKILLVLAAVVAMTIGAVSTVMAADDHAVISSWGGDAKNGYTAFDANGEQIARGWAISPESGRWYFFDSGKMLVNTFITYNQEIYYLDGTGCMASGCWVGFDAKADDTTYDTQVNTVDKYIKDSYDKISDIDGFNDVFEFKTDAAGATIFDEAGFNTTNNKSKDKVVWCYFYPNGTMAQNEWVNSADIYYYVAGAYCVVGDYSVVIKTNTDSDLKDTDEGIFGFGFDGALLRGWQPWVNGRLVNNASAGYDPDTPYNSGVASKVEADYWTYYAPNGMQVNTNKDACEVQEGWEKIDGQWCYFINDPYLGQLLLQDTILTDTDANIEGLLKNDEETGVFYLDDNGYMYTGVKTFAKKEKVFLATEGDSRQTVNANVREFSEDTIYLFDTTIGKELDGVQGNYYYRYITSKTALDDQIFVVKKEDITTSGVIYVDVTTGQSIATWNGQRVEAKNFFVVLSEDKVNDFNGDGDKNDPVILYFEHGRLQKNQAVTFGEVTIGISENGAVITELPDTVVKVAGYKYQASGDDLILVDEGGNETVIPGLKKK